MLSYCLLNWAGQRAPVYPLYATCRSLNGHVVPALAVSFQLPTGSSDHQDMGPFHFFTAHCPLELPKKHCALLAARSKLSHELLPKYIKQDAKQGPSSQFAQRAGSGSGLQAFSMELRGLSVRAQVRV